MKAPDPNVIVTLQREKTALWHEQTPGESESGFAGLVEANHLRNFQLWHHEDVARRDDVGFEPVYRAKRAIDRCNQERNDFVEKMDQALVAALNPPSSGCPFNSETPGMMIDRLSILALKEYHMREQTERAEVDEAHRRRCSEKLNVIGRQIDDLRLALGDLLDGVRSGTRSFRVYFQFKMYNDPALNPELYQRSPPDAKQGD